MGVMGVILHPTTGTPKLPLTSPHPNSSLGPPKIQAGGVGWGVGAEPSCNYITNKAQLKLRINQTAENKTFLSGTSNKRNENNKAGWVMKSQGCE